MTRPSITLPRISHHRSKSRDKTTNLLFRRRICPRIPHIPRRKKLLKSIPSLSWIKHSTTKEGKNKKKSSMQLKKRASMKRRKTRMSSRNQKTKRI